MSEPLDASLEPTVQIQSLDDVVFAGGDELPAGTTGLDGSALDAGWQSDQLIGKTIAGRYLIESYLGGGGMSHVYKARHLHINDKVVALKLLQSQDFVDPQQVLRLQQEANAAGSLSHPNIIAVQDFGLSSSTQPYLVMDYFAGRSLEQLIKADGPIDLDRLVGIVGQVCSALAHAHEHGVIHRDIKPSNIMVAQDENGKDVVKVVDFGIAKRSTADAEISKLTHTGDILGSPLYMSPEQCLGRAVDGRSDVYSLGCVIYESITGVSPFVGDSVFETIYRHLNEAPRALSAGALGNSHLKGLEAIVFRMLAKLPDDRHRFMVEVANDLKQLEYQGNSATGQLRLLWGLWKARSSARAKKSVVLDTGLTVASVTAVVVALLLFALPGTVRDTAVEEVRNKSVVLELKNMARVLSGEESLLEDIFQGRDLTPTGSPARAHLFQIMQRLGYLCSGRPEEEAALEAMRKSGSDAMESTVRFRKSFVRKLIFGGPNSIKQNTDFASLMRGWSESLSQSGEQSRRSAIAGAQLQRQRILFENIFEISKWLGLLLLPVIPAISALRWRGRKKS